MGDKMVILLINRHDGNVMTSHLHDYPPADIWVVDRGKEEEAIRRVGHADTPRYGTPEAESSFSCILVRPCKSVD